MARRGGSAVTRGRRPPATARATGAALGLALGLASGAAAEPAGAGVRFVPLGDLAGGAFLSDAADVSDRGPVVVGRAGGALGIEAFRWKDGVLEGLGDLPGGQDLSAACAVTPEGDTIVGVGFWPPGEEALRWRDGAIEPLGDLPGGRYLSRARGVSDDGERVVGKSNSSLGTAAFLWEDGVMKGLGDLGNEDFSSQAWAISGNGRVVVGGGNAPEGLEPLRWSAAGGLEGLGDLYAGEEPAPLFERPQALGVSRSGRFVVGTAAAPEGNAAFVWTEQAGMQRLFPADEPGGTLAAAEDVTTNGALVVGRWETAAGRRAFLWRRGAGPVTLQDWLSTQIGVTIEGWTLTSARAISNDGRYLVGSGRNPDGFEEGWLVDLPAPASGRAAAAALLTLALLRRTATASPRSGLDLIAPSTRRAAARTASCRGSRRPSRCCGA